MATFPSISFEPSIVAWAIRLEGVKDKGPFRLEGTELSEATGFQDDFS